MLADRTNGTDLQIVYYSSRSENTHRFAQKLNKQGVTVARLPLSKERMESFPTLSLPYLLLVATYGAGGGIEDAVPEVVRVFLQRQTNRMLCRGVIGGGNRNFGPYFCYGARLIAAKLTLPLLYQFELSGLPEDVDEVVRITNSYVPRLENADPSVTFH